MKISIILKIVSMLFVIITAVLLLLTVFDFISSEEVREAILKSAIGCAIIAVASGALMLLSKKS